jgi:hypothetical protein
MEIRMEIKVSVLILLFGLEFLLIFMILAFLLWRKLKKGAALAGFDYEGLEKHIEAEIDRLGSEAGGLEGGEAAKKTLARDIYALKLGLISSIKKGRLDKEEIGRDIEKLVEEILKKMAVAGPPAPEASADKAPAAAPAPAPAAPAINYKKLIIEFLGHKQILEELQQEFGKLKETNTTYIDKIVDEATSSEPLQQLTMDMEKAGLQMDKRIGVLNKESLAIGEKIKNFETLFIQTGGKAGAAAFEVGAAAAAGKAGGVMESSAAVKAKDASFMETQSIGAADKKIQARVFELEAREKILIKEAEELKKEVEKKDKSLKTLQENYATLETEYINMYKEHKGETGLSG